MQKSASKETLKRYSRIEDAAYKFGYVQTSFERIVESLNEGIKASEGFDELADLVKIAKGVKEILGTDSIHIMILRIAKISEDLKERYSKLVRKMQDEASRKRIEMKDDAYLLEVKIYMHKDPDISKDEEKRITRSVMKELLQSFTDVRTIENNRKSYLVTFNNTHALIYPHQVYKDYQSDNSYLEIAVQILGKQNKIDLIRMLKDKYGDRLKKPLRGSTQPFWQKGKEVPGDTEFKILNDLA